MHVDNVLNVQKLLPQSNNFTSAQLGSKVYTLKNPNMPGKRKLNKIIKMKPSSSEPAQMQQVNQPRLLLQTRLLAS